MVRLEDLYKGIPIELEVGPNDRTVNIVVCGEGETVFFRIDDNGRYSPNNYASLDALWIALKENRANVWLLDGNAAKTKERLVLLVEELTRPEKT